VSSRLTSSTDHVPRPSLQTRYRAVARITELERYAEDRRKIRAEKEHEPARQHDGHGGQVEWGWLKQELAHDQKIANTESSFSSVVERGTRTSTQC
jgi:hypothetical protein